LRFVVLGPPPYQSPGLVRPGSAAKLRSMIIEFGAQAKHLQDFQLMIKARQHVLREAFTENAYVETPPALTAALEKANFEIEQLRLEFRELYPKLRFLRPHPRSNFSGFAELESDY
ncbi:MAG: hypothetical protein Q9192_007513, partial [Flavoplaca navasiana]